MLFWGIGTSKIGAFSFGWEDTGSAAALAVATIIIPAIDSFMSGKGAREFWGTVSKATTQVQHTRCYYLIRHLA